MGSFIPLVTQDDVERILIRDFPAELHGKIRKLIGDVGVREKPRVIVACMKNSGGDWSKLQGELVNAEGYWREIISEAEYPKIKKARSLGEDQISERRKAQYLQWFDKKESS